MSDPDATSSVLSFRSPSDIARAIPAAVAHLRVHGVLAHPTETVYGLGGSIDPATVDVLAQLKPRGADRPFVVLVASRLMLEQHIAGALSTDAAALAAHFWPGPLTLVIPAPRSLPDRLRGATDGIAVRWTSHAGLQQLIAAYGAPITSTSANRSGVPPATTVAEIAEVWDDAMAQGIVRVLDGGPLPASLASTVVDCTEHSPRIVRVGVVPIAAVRAVVPTTVGPS